MRPDKPSDPALHTAALPLGPMAYTDNGHPGPAVVLVHGMPGSHRDFRWLDPAMDADIRVVRVDLPGFGATPLSTAPATDLAGRGLAVKELLDALDIRGALLVGHSMGGGVATACATLTDRVAGLALIASLGPTPHRARRAHRPEPLARLLRTPLLGTLLLPLVRRGFTSAGFKETDRAVLQHTLDCVVGTSFADHRRHLKALSLPTAVIWADDDSFIEPAIFEALAEFAPTGPRLRFDTGGHNIQKSRAVEIAALLSDLARTLHA